MMAKINIALPSRKISETAKVINEIFDVICDQFNEDPDYELTFDEFSDISLRTVKKVARDVGIIDSDAFADIFVERLCDYNGEYSFNDFDMEVFDLIGNGNTKLLLRMRNVAMTLTDDRVIEELEKKFVR
jgi:hypothetical protein